MAGLRPSGQKASDSKVQRNILTVTEPSVPVDPMKVPFPLGEDGLPLTPEAYEELGGDKSYEKYLKFVGLMIPWIRINEYEMQITYLTRFTLNNTGFIPTISITFVDRDQSFQERHYPTDGMIIQLYIRPQGSLNLKPIRVDFTVLEIYPVGGNTTQETNKFKIEGKMLVPNLYNEFVEYYDGTSYDCLRDVASNLDLGFASNVEDTKDSMVWINPNDTREKFIQDVTANSYFDDNHFFKSYIDWYYYLTLVDINKLYSQVGAVEIAETFSQNAGDLIEPSAVVDDEIGPLGVTEGFPDVLTNMAQFQGDARYLSKYQVTNNTGKIANINGYKRYAQWWDLQNKAFINEFVDPIVTNNPTAKVNGQETIKLKGRVLVDPDSGAAVPQGIAQTQSKYKYLGRQSDNVHDHFMYSVVQNYQNNIETNKLGMIVELDTVNPALVRYSRIYVYVIDYGPLGSTLQDAVEADTDGGDGLNVTDDGAKRIVEAVEEDGKTPLEGTAGLVENTFLSGFYVITGLEYFFKQAAPGPAPGTPAMMRMRVHLSRREFYPST